MSGKDLKYFMREQKEEIVEAPAPKGFKDENGKPLTLEIKVISNKQIQDIFANYRKRKVATNEKGIPYLGLNSEVVMQTDRDTPRAIRHIIVESLIYPNLQDKKLMDYYKCYDVTDMPQHVFPKADEYAHVSKMVMDALGLGDGTPTDDELIDDAKN